MEYSFCCHNRFAHGALHERDGPVPISVGRDPISPVSVKRSPSLVYALSLPCSKRPFSLFTPPEIFGSYLLLQFCFLSLSAEVDRNRSIGARHRRKFIVDSLSSTMRHNLVDIVPYRWHYIYA